MTIDTRSNLEEGKNNGGRFFGNSRKRFAVMAGAAVLSLALIAGACSNGGESGEGAGHEGGSEGGGEHSESGEGREGAGEHSESGEGGGEHSEGAGHSHEGGESGEETSPTLPVSQPTSGTFNNLDYRAAYDEAANSFKATVTNNTDQTVCASRVEVHMAVKGQVTELGPTARVDLKPGESNDVELPAGSVVPDTYTIHPESSPCP